jgi:thioredoxin-related protein
MMLYMMSALKLCLIVWAMGAPVAAQAAELVMFESKTCAWCKEWHRVIGPVYSKTTEGRLAPLRRVDIHEVRPADLAAIKPVVYTPTFVIVDAGEEIGRIEGYPGEDFFWGLLGAHLSKLSSRASAS